MADSAQPQAGEHCLSCHRNPIEVREHCIALHCQQMRELACSVPPPPQTFIPPPSIIHPPTQYECLPCAHKTLCKACAMKQATGGRCVAHAQHTCQGLTSMLTR